MELIARRQNWFHLQDFWCRGLFVARRLAYTHILPNGLAQPLKAPLKGYRPMRPFVLLSAVLLSGTTMGCAGTLAGSAGLSNVASAIEAVGSTATGLRSAQSTSELNGANKELINAQTALTETQVSGTQVEHERLAQERSVTARLLREMSRDYNDRIFLTLAEWVEAGGDPDFAFKYALARIDGSGGVKVLPQQTMTVAQPAQSLPSKNKEECQAAVREQVPPYLGFFPY